MNIAFTPQRCDSALAIVKEGSVLWINGLRYAFDRPIAEINGEFFDPAKGDPHLIAFDHETMTVTVVNPIPEHASDDQLVVTVLTNVSDGPVPIPKGIAIST